MRSGRRAGFPIQQSSEFRCCCRGRKPAPIQISAIQAWTGKPPRQADHRRQQTPLPPEFWQHHRVDPNDACQQVAGRVVRRAGTGVLKTRKMIASQTGVVEINCSRARGTKANSGFSHTFLLLASCNDRMSAQWMEPRSEASVRCLSMGYTTSNIKPSVDQALSHTLSRYFRPMVRSTMASFSAAIFAANALATATDPAIY